MPRPAKFNGGSDMTKNESLSLRKEADEFLKQHRGHDVLASSAEAHYFNLWCVTCEKGKSARGQARVNGRSCV